MSSVSGVCNSILFRIFRYGIFFHIGCMCNRACKSRKAVVILQTLRIDCMHMTIYSRVLWTGGLTPSKLIGCLFKVRNWLRRIYCHRVRNFLEEKCNRSIRSTMTQSENQSQNAPRGTSTLPISESSQGRPRGMAITSVWAQIFGHRRNSRGGESRPESTPRSQMPRGDAPPVSEIVLLGSRALARRREHHRDVSNFSLFDFHYLDLDLYTLSLSLIECQEF